ARTACSRGPCPPVGTPAGSEAHVERPQPGHRRRWSWYSVTSGRSGGRFNTCWGRGGGSGPGKALPSPGGRGGLGNLGWCGGGGGRGRCRRSCPGRPPGLRPETGRGGRRLTVDKSVEGGREELVELWFSRSCRSWTCCWSARTLARNSAASACSVRIGARASG